MLLSFKNMDESPRRIVVLGKTGAGKSLANILCGEPVYNINNYTSSGTRKCQSKFMCIAEKNILFIDTPGLFDTDRSEEEMKSEIVRCITECAPGPHAFLIVLKVEKYIEHEKAVIEKMNQYFSDEALRFAMIVFTHGDQLPERKKIDDFVKQSEALSDLIKKCGGRCHVIDNKNRRNQYQVAELLKTIDKIIEANKEGYFTNNMLLEVIRDIQQEKACIKRSSPDITDETATKAKNTVFENLLKMVKAEGVSKGALLGEFLGGDTKLMKEEGSVCSGERAALERAAGAAEVNRILTDGATASGTVFSSVTESARRIVVLGKTGSGKSSLVNTLCGEPVFKVNHTTKSGTKECQSVDMNIGGRSILVINTPGFFDTDRSEAEMKSEILRCITECAPGPHVFLIVLKVEKYTQFEMGVIDKIKQYFSDEAFRFAMIVFTHGDQLPEGMKIEEFVNESEALSNLIKKCGGRCHVIDNKYWKNNQGDEYRNNQYQVGELLKTIDKIIEANKGGYFTNKMLQGVKRDIQQDEGRIKQSSPNITEEECATKAKHSMLDKAFKAVGITT